MSYLSALNAFSGNPMAGYRTPALSGFWNATTAGGLTTGQSTVLPGIWAFSPQNSVLPPNVLASNLFNTSTMTLTIPYDGIYQLSFSLRTNSNNNGNNTNTNQFGWWKVITGNMVNTNSRLAFTHSFGDTIGSTYIGFLRAGNQLQPSCFTGGSNITVVELTQNAPYMTVTLVAPGTSYDSTAAQAGAGLILS